MASGGKLAGGLCRGRNDQCSPEVVGFDTAVAADVDLIEEVSDPPMLKLHEIFQDSQHLARPLAFRSFLVVLRRPKCLKKKAVAGDSNRTSESLRGKN